jgi:hypothetical protein
MYLRPELVPLGDVWAQLYIHVTLEPEPPKNLVMAALLKHKPRLPAPLPVLVAVGVVAVRSVVGAVVGSVAGLETTATGVVGTDDGIDDDEVKLSATRRAPITALLGLM